VLFSNDLAYVYILIVPSRIVKTGAFLEGNFEPEGDKPFADSELLKVLYRSDHSLRILVASKSKA